MKNTDTKSTDFLSRRNFLKYVVSTATIATVIPVTSYATQKKRKPNLIVILTDDQGYADVGFNGCKDIPTPNIDKIAKNGVKCTNGYVTFPVCGPSRAGLLTGRYQGRFGFRTNPTVNPECKEAGLPLEEKNIAEVLGQVGYKSTIIGKYHMGSHPIQHPLKRGFTEFFGFLSGGHNYFPKNLKLDDLSKVTRPWQWYTTRLMRNHKRVDIEEYLTDELSQEAVSFMERHKKDPFFLYLAYNAPHEPLQATEKYLKRFNHIKDPKRKIYAAMISAVDDGVGSLLKKLKKLKLEEDTLIFFLSDNGGIRKKNKMFADNGPLRDGKGSVHEGGVRVPFAVQWKGVLPAGKVYDHPVSSMDIMGTISHLAEAPISNERPLDGVNIIPHLKGEVTTPPHDLLFWNKEHNDGFAVRQNDLKLANNKNGNQSDAGLYNLKDDIGEKKSLKDQQLEKADSMFSAYSKWKKDLKPLAFPPLSEKWWVKKKK